MSPRNRRRSTGLESQQQSQAPNPIQAARLTIESHSGPLPSPEVLARFNEIVTGAADRIFAVFEKQAAHRMHLERTVIEGERLQANAGLVFGFLIVIAFLIACVYLGINGQAWLAGVLGSVDLAALVAVFVYADRSRRAERSTKAELTRSPR